MGITKEDAIELRDLLERHSRSEKHIGYHILPEVLNALLAGTGYENRYTFYERERAAFFHENVDVRGKSVIDIGCNIGYFLFDFLDHGAERVVGYEGKQSCGEFVEKAINILGMGRRFEFHNDYYEFDITDGNYDVGVLLNVLHHLGDDYGSGKLGLGSAKEMMLNQLNELSKNVGTLIFQMGFNWKGDRNICLFEKGTKAEMIDYIEKGTKNYWEVARVGIPERHGNGIHYKPLSESNIARDDSLGEFLNRPVFILKSKA